MIILTEEDTKYIKNTLCAKENILLEIAFQLERIADVLQDGSINIKR